MSFFILLRASVLTKSTIWYSTWEDLIGTTEAEDELPEEALDPFSVQDSDTLSFLSCRGWSQGTEDSALMPFKSKSRYWISFLKGVSEGKEQNTCNE